VKKKLWTWVRILVSLVLMILVLRSVDLGKVLKDLRSSDVRLLTLALGLNVVVTFLLAWRWKVLLKSQSLRVGYLRLVATYFTSLFSANFLPTAIGGDLVRAYYVWKDTQKRAVAVASVLVERLIGSISLFAIALVSAALVGSQKGSREFLLVVGLVTLGFLLSVWLFFSRSFVAFLDRSLGSPDVFGLRVKMKKLYESILSYLDKKQAALEVFGISVFLQGVVILMWFVVGKALGFHVGLVVYFLYVPVLGVISVLPFSINAWGLQEWSSVVLFSRAGLVKEEALVLGGIAHLIAVATSLIGGITFLARGEKPDVADMEKAGEN
jgi:glycosyltransferase 2 family protein